MADIFLTYAQEDLAKAKRLAAALEKQGWSVFWDSLIRAGDNFGQEIEREIQQAGCMIVAWSNNSVSSHWVFSGATVGLELDILVPILFESVKPPQPFGDVHTEDLAAWQGEADSAAFIALCETIRKRIGSGENLIGDQEDKTKTNHSQTAKSSPGFRELKFEIGKI